MKLILGSKSPRRHALIKELGFPVEIRIKEVEEIYPENLSGIEVPEYLAKLKAEPHIEMLDDDEVLVCSDTIVLLENEIIGKPENRAIAVDTLNRLSGKTHKVITGVSLTTRNKQETFRTETKVHFSELTQEDIETYIDKYQPYDKAGSYGIQEWIGYIGVEKIDGCYYNVMGLPLHDLNKALKNFMN